MEFESANPSVVRSIKQRDLLNAWLRALGADRTLPALADYRPDRIADELPDMMGFDVEGERRHRAVPDHPGRREADRNLRQRAHRPRSATNRYLDDAIGPERYARVVACYRACLAAKAADLFDFDGAGCRRQGRFLRAVAAAVRQRR